MRKTGPVAGLGQYDPGCVLLLFLLLARKRLGHWPPGSLLALGLCALGSAAVGVCALAPNVRPPAVAARRCTPEVRGAQPIGDPGAARRVALGP